MSKLTLYHGSSEIIEKPLYGKGRRNNDYGKGFYCTEHIELAKEWSCNENADGYANCYEFDTTGLNILKLTSNEYNVLHWLALLLDNRVVSHYTPVMSHGVKWLKEHFLIDISQYDVIIGYRADDSYFSFARAFVRNEISLMQLSNAMKLGKLGEQVVLKSEKAFERVNFVSYEVADSTIYHAKRKARDDDARSAYIVEVAKEDIDGIYMRDIIREEMMADDARLG